ncbi:MAG: hypothetical protein A6F71_10495 [Cycloclasticus sp. symbiont of Poecilosclerida sp. M]|nr:MAG: hypothetical protein A6F71_10495 [Cycloclasticus sp. symbiont of Poecilosclerida sp. M]
MKKHKQGGPYFAAKCGFFWGPFLAAKYGPHLIILLLGGTIFCLGGPLMAAKIGPGDHFWQPKSVRGTTFAAMPKMVWGTDFRGDRIWRDRLRYARPNNSMRIMRKRGDRFFRRGPFLAAKNGPGGPNFTGDHIFRDSPNARARKWTGL